jgi:hypothetical protein
VQRKADKRKIDDTMDRMNVSVTNQIMTKHSLETLVSQQIEIFWAYNA